MSAEDVRGELEQSVLCERCQGNGEIILDWEMYLNEDRDDESVADCPDCSGTGYASGIDPVTAALARSVGETTTAPSSSGDTA